MLQSFGKVLQVSQDFLKRLYNFFYMDVAIIIIFR